MSAIAGIFFFDGRPVEPPQIRSMTHAMTHRGPDGIHHWCHGNVALGQCMFRTTPESLGEIQPLTNENESVALVMDGRVDNYEEVRRNLLAKGAKLRTRADAELVLRAYEIWGEDCADRLIGECVYVIVDIAKRRMFGARDAAGARHFYLHAGNGWFAFASEIGGLLALGTISRQLNESRMLDFLAPQFARHDEVGTFYSDIQRLPAGHAMTVTRDGLLTWRYWDPRNLEPIRFSSIDECAEAFLDQLKTVVKCRMRSIGPVGAMLSGGLDSSSIVALLSQDFRGDLRQPLRTISLVRKNKELCPEWQSIREMLKDDFLVPTILDATILNDKWRQIAHYGVTEDEPYAMTPGLTNRLVYESARDIGCKVVFDGMAGDTLFFHPEGSLSIMRRAGAYRHFFALLAAMRRYGNLNHLWSVPRGIAVNFLPKSVRAWHRRSVLQHELASGDLSLIERQTALDYLTPKLLGYSKSDQSAKESNLTIEHASSFTVGLLSYAHEAYGSMAFRAGVEPRSPFSDRRLIEFAVKMPVEAKLPVGWYKNLLRIALGNRLPRAVKWRTGYVGHPGSEFYAAMITQMAAAAPSMSSFSTDTAAEFLPWKINARQLSLLASRIQRAEHSDEEGLRWYSVNALARWIEAR